MKREYNGSILAVRAVENCIRATGKYTEVGQRPSAAVQGDAPSAVLTKHYRVRPDIDVEEMMSLGQAIWKTFSWLSGESIRIQFHYDYREDDKAKVTIEGGNGGVCALESGIPGFTAALAAVGAAS